MQVDEMDIARVVVTGSTRFTDQALEWDVLMKASSVARARGASFRVLTGTAEGADELAREWAQRNNVNLFAEDLESGPYPEPMHRYNEQLLSLRPDVVLAFKAEFDANWASPACIAGTEHMCRIASEASIPVLLNGTDWLVSSEAGPEHRGESGEAPVLASSGQVVLEMVEGDITSLRVDVIVNAANSSLLGGGGVDGAIHRAAGPQLLDECRAVVARQGGCKVGEAVITGAGALTASHVVHTVGPVFQNAAADSLMLASCYRKSLRVAAAAGARSIAFPNISTGVYRFPRDLACKVATVTVRDWLRDNPASSINHVVFCCFDRENAILYQDALSEIEPRTC